MKDGTSFVHAHDPTKDGWVTQHLEDEEYRLMSEEDMATTRTILRPGPG